MNCQDHLYRSTDPRHGHPPLVLRAMRRRPRRDRARRSCSARPGCAAPAPTAAQSARAQGAALRAQGEARHLPVHGRRAEPARTVRPQAAAREVRRHAAAAGAAQGLPRRVHQSELEAARARSSSSPSTASAGRSCPSCCRTWPTVVDDIAIVKSMATDAFNHAPGQIFMNTGSQQFGRPSMGAWVTYGLGSESQDLPGFVVFSSGQQGPQRRRRRTGAAASCRPSIRACRSAASGEPVLYLSNPQGVDRDVQRDSLDARQRPQPAAARRRRRPRDRHAHQLLRDGLSACRPAPRS